MPESPVRLIGEGDCRLRGRRDTVRERDRGYGHDRPARCGAGGPVGGAAGNFAIDARRAKPYFSGNRRDTPAAR